MNKPYGPGIEGTHEIERLSIIAGFVSNTWFLFLMMLINIGNFTNWHTD